MNLGQDHWLTKFSILHHNMYIITVLNAYMHLSLNYVLPTPTELRCFKVSPLFSTQRCICNVHIHVHINIENSCNSTCYLAILSFIHLSLMPCSVNMCERRREVMRLKRSPLIGSTDLGALPPLMNNLWPLEMPTGSISDCGWERKSISTHSPMNTTPTTNHWS